MANDTEQKPVPQPPRREISRRPVVVGLIGLAVAEAVAGGITWKVLSQGLRKIALAFAPPIPTPISPGTILFLYKGHSNGVNEVKWFLDDKRIVSGADDQTVQVWDATTGRRALIYRGQTGRVLTVACSPDGKHIASAGASPPTQPPVVTSLSPTDGPTSGGTAVTISGSGFTGATHVSFGSTAATNVNVVSDSQITAISPSGSGTVDVTVTNPNGTSQTSSADQFTYTSPPVVSSLDQASGPASGGTTVTISGSGFTGATGVSFGSTASTNVNVVSDSQILATSPAGNGMVDVTVTTPDGTSATSSADQFTYILPPSPVVPRLDSFTYTSPLPIPTDPPAPTPAPPTSVPPTPVPPTPTPSPLPAPIPPFVEVWDASTGKTVLIYKGHTKTASMAGHTVNSVAWSPDGRYIASGSSDTTVQVWDASTGKTIFIYLWHPDVVNSVAWSPDGKRIASGSSDKTVQVWDASTGNHIFTYTRHSDAVNSVTWSPDGKRIASGSSDATVQVWDAGTGSHVFTYTRHVTSVNTVSWSPSGIYIASAGRDTTVQVWKAI